MKKLEGQKVEYLKFVKNPDKLTYDKNAYTKEVEGIALFLGFGVDEGEEGGTFSTAIIKLPTGEVKNVYVELIRFIRKD